MTQRGSLVLMVSLTVGGCGTVVSPGPSETLDAGPAADAEDVVPPDGATGCVSRAETCNGVDDDCTEGGADLGCPLDAPLGDGAHFTSGVIGGTTTAGTANTSFRIACPAGAVITGFHGGAAESIDSLGAYCGIPTVQHLTSQGGGAYSYRVGVLPSDPAPAVGGPGGGGFDSPCPADTVVTGGTLWVASNSNGVSIYGLSATCTALVVSGDIGSFTISYGASVALDRVATGNAGLPADPVASACPGVGVVQEMTGYYGPWPIYTGFTVVNGLSATCVVPTLPLTP